MIAERPAGSAADRLAALPSPPATLLLAGPSADRLQREAIDLAASLLCPEREPERSCDSCRRVRTGIHPDVFLVEPDGVQIRIDRVREAIAFAAGRPYESRRRVAIVSRAEQLGAEAGNALLKSLEEPGSRFHWILTTTRPEAILPTILSRCTTLRVSAPSGAERAAVWRDLGLDEADAPDLALFAGGDVTASAETLEAFRRRRNEILAALEEGLAKRRLVALIALAETVGREPGDVRLLAELLADAASAERVRHRAVSAAIGRIARAASPEAFGRAALMSLDSPPDNRRGSRRLHFEAVLLDLYLSGETAAT